MNNKVSLTTQNRLIVFGLLLSTVLIMAIAIFSVINIQKKLNQGYQNFGQVISKTLAIESAEITKNLDLNDIYNTLKAHTDSILKSHNDIVFIEFTDKDGKIIHSDTNEAHKSTQRPNITVSSPLTGVSNTPVGAVTVGLSGNIISQISSTTRASLLFVFALAWLVFAFVILINTYLITRELRILHDGVRKISGGNFGYKIEGENVSNEVQELFDSFNDMSARLHIYEEQNIEQLTLERNKLEAVLMSIANGVVVCDNNDNVVLVNNHAQTLLDVNEDQILNKPIQNYIDTEGNHCFKEKIEEFKTSENKFVYFNITVDKRVIKAIISPMFTRSNDYVGYIIVLIDITKEAEMDLMRSQFISNVSHELRTPVTVLRSYIDTLYTMGDEFDYETQKEFIGTLNNEIIRLNTMVNDILDFSRLDSDMELEKTYNDISRLVEDCVNQIQILAADKKVTIEISKEAQTNEFLFNYDSIERALRNLLSNAIKYSPEGKKIRVRLYKPSENEVALTVQDEGCGISPEHQKKVFDRFFRVENNTHTIKGTGLGLHLVKTTIEKHHQGKVFVESQLGEGSTFGFILPLNTEVLV
ncbi:MAG: cell wall metabolism sensor histidine kinase WalK [Cyanobacteria bacterium SIG32]|nr:cell wall metabolism sensor histidine kinase WalK [Cyanobacteria bacterium SIG32]